MKNAAHDVETWLHANCLIDNHWKEGAFTDILTVMENYGPYYGASDLFRNGCAYVFEKYKALIDAVLQYLTVHPDKQKAKQLYDFVQGDVALFEQHHSDRYPAELCKYVRDLYRNLLPLIVRYI